MEWISVVKAEDLEYEPLERSNIMTTMQQKMERASLMSLKKKLVITLGIVLAICVIGVGVNHALFLNQLENQWSGTVPVSEGNVNINPITNTITISVKKLDLDLSEDNPFGGLGLAVLAAMAPSFEREMDAVLAEKAAEHSDYYALLVPFKVKFNISLLDLLR